MTDTTATDSTNSPADPPQPQQGQQGNQGNPLPDWASDPAAAFKMVNDLRAENARDRTAAKDAAATQARADLLKSLGLKEDQQPVTPEAHQQALSQRDATIRDLTIRGALNDALASQNAKPVARAAILGDRVLDGLDPSGDTFQADVLSKVSGYLDSNPDLKASTGQAPGSSSTDGPGGQQQQTLYTRAQLRDPAFYQANKADIEAAMYDGRITD